MGVETTLPSSELFWVVLSDISDRLQAIVLALSLVRCSVLHRDTACFNITYLGRIK